MKWVFYALISIAFSSLAFQASDLAGMIVSLIFIIGLIELLDKEDVCSKSKEE